MNYIEIIIKKLIFKELLKYIIFHLLKYKHSVYKISFIYKTSKQKKNFVQQFKIR